MTINVPSQARAVVVGGGIVGCSVGYHLATLGWTDTIVLEQNKIAGGTTWHAAGQVGRLRVSRGMTEVNKYSAELYARLEAETGVSTGWKATGSLMVAASQDRMTQLRRTVAMAELFDVEAEIVDLSVAAEKWPRLRVDDLVGAAWIPGDGKVNPEWTARSLAAGLTQRGATRIEGVRVCGLLRRNGRIVGVQTEQGPIEAQIVVLCGGMWTRQLALEAGLHIPLYPVEHHYVVTEPLAGIHDDLPMLRDPDSMTYVRPDGNTLVLGGFQAMSNPWLVDRVPDDFSFQLLEEDWRSFAVPLARGKHRLPFLESVQFPRFVNGPESFTPDNNFLLGPLAGVQGCYVAAGFNSAGIACAGGAGKLLAEWIEAGEAPRDLWEVDPRRFAPWHNNRALLRDRVRETLGWHYALAWPNREPITARGIRKSPLYDRLKSVGACFGTKMGWERPNFFAPPTIAPEIHYGWERQNWFSYSAAEHQAIRQSVAICEQTSFGKLTLEGPEALRVLQWLCANNIDVPPGSVVYTAMLNRRGTFESDLTVTRVADDRFYLVTSSSQPQRDFDRIASHLLPETRAVLTDVTNSFGVIGLMGPKSRDVLQCTTDAAVDNRNFPYGAARKIAVGMADAFALRMSYVGELGWELHIPLEQLPHAYDALWDAGQGFGIVNAGHYAINSLRLEKGYCAWGPDISANETPLEAGLKFAVSFKKDFLGRIALEEQMARPLNKRRLVFVLSDPQVTTWGGEPIWRDNRKVGYTTSGAYGHSVGGAVAMGYIPLLSGELPAQLLSSAFEIECNGQRHSAQPYLQGPYDPSGDRMRC